RAGALVLVYEQLDDIAAVALLDEHGAVIGSVAQDDGRHPRVDAATVAHIAHASEPVDAAFPIVPIATPIGSWTLAVGLSLRGACGGLAGDVATRLVDGHGKLLCGTAATGDVLSASATPANGWTPIAEQP